MKNEWLKIKTIIGLVALMTVWACTVGDRVSDQKSTKVTSPSPEPNSYYFYTEAQILRNRGEISRAIEMMFKAQKGDPDAIHIRRELALLHLQNKQEEQALALLQGILQDYPGDIPTLLILGRLHQNRKEWDKAKSAYEIVLEQDPDQEDVYLQLGNLYMNDAQWDDAFDVFKRQIERFPGAYAGYFFLGKIYKKRGQDDLAESAFLKSLAIEPELEGARLELIELYEKQPDNPAMRKKTVDLYRMILDEDPDNIRANLGLALYYRKIGKLRQARKLLQQQVEKASENDLIRVVFRSYIEPGHHQDAIFLLEEMLRFRNDFVSLHYLLGVAYNALEKPAPAMNHFKAVTPGSRFYRDAVLQQAYRYSEDGNTEETIRLLENALIFEPDHPDFLVFLASMYEEKEAFEDALALLKRAVEVDPDNERAYFRMGVVYDKMDMKDESIATMKQVITLKPDHANALNYLGYTYADLGINLEEAEMLIQKALQIKPNDGYITDSLGWVYYKQGRYQEALTLLLKASELAPDDAIILEHVGDTYQKLGDRARALEYYRKSLSIRKKDKDAILMKIETLESQDP